MSKPGALDDLTTFILSTDGLAYSELTKEERGRLVDLSVKAMKEVMEETARDSDG